MSLGPLAKRFFFEEVADRDEDRIIEVTRRRASGIEHLTFNVFNLELDFTERRVKIEDDLDATAEEYLGMDGFLSALSSKEFRRPR